MRVAEMMTAAALLAVPPKSVGCRVRTGNNHKSAKAAQRAKAKKRAQKQARKRQQRTR